MTLPENQRSPVAGEPNDGLLAPVADTRCTRWSTVVACLFLLAFTCLFFRAPIFGRRVFHIWDHSIIYVPIHVYNARLRAAGEIPLWNRHGFLGWPTQAETERSGIYPPTLIFNLVDDPGAAYTIYVMFHFVLALAATMYLTRVTGAGIAGQTVAALVFVFGGSFSGLSYGMTLVTTFAWVPLILALLLRAFERRSYAMAVLAGVVHGIQLLGVNPHTGFFTLLLIAMVVLLEARGPNRWSRFLFAVKATLLAELVALGLGAPQVFYLLEYMSLTDRTVGFGYTDQVSGSLPPHYLFQLLVPNMLGYDRTVHFQFSEMHFYCGLLSLGFVTLGWRAQHRFVALWRLVLIAGVILALGRFVGIYHILWKLPGFSQIHYPIRFLIVASLGASVLAGVGFDRLVRKTVDVTRVRMRFVAVYVGCFIGLLAMGLMASAGHANESLQAAYYWIVNLGLSGPLRVQQNAERFAGFARSVFTGCFLAALCAVYWYFTSRARSHRWLSGAAIALLSLDLLICIGPTYHFGPADFYNVTPAHVKFLRRDHSLWRVCRGYLKFDFIFPKPGGFALDNSALFGIDALNWCCGAHRTDLSAFIGSERKPGGNATAKQLALFNVKYFLTERELTEDNLTRFKLEERFSDGGWWIYENLDCQPRISIRERWTAVTNLHHAKRVINSNKFSLTESVTLEAPEGEYVPGEVILQPEKVSTARVVSYGAHQVTIDARLVRPGILVLSDLYYPGWKATSNGRDVKILVANGIVRGLALGPGRHTVVFSFQPKSFYLGLCVAAVVSVSLMVWTLLWLRKRTRA